MRYHCPHVRQASTKQNMTAELEWAGKRWLHRLEMKMEMKTNVVYGTNNLELSIKIINIPTLKLNIPTLWNLLQGNKNSNSQRHTNTFINNDIIYKLNKKPEAK